MTTHQTRKAYLRGMSAARRALWDGQDPAGYLARSEYERTIPEAAAFLEGFRRALAMEAASTPAPSTPAGD